MSIHINPRELPFVFTATGAVAANTVAVDWDTETLNCPSFAMQFTSVGAGAVIRVEYSSDQVVWVTGRAETINVGSTGSDLSAVSMYVVPRASRFFRLRFTTAQTSGTTRIAITESFATPINTVSLGGNVSALCQGSGAHDAAIVGVPLRTGARAVTANYTTIANNDTVDSPATLTGAQIYRPFSIPEADWQYAAATGGIAVATAVAAKGAVASNRNYVTGLQVRNSGAVATEFVVLSNATVIWRSQLPAAMTGSMNITLNTPLRGGVNEAISVQALTAGAAVYANLQGYVAP